MKLLSNYLNLGIPSDSSDEVFHAAVAALIKRHNMLIASIAAASILEQQYHQQPSAEPLNPGQIVKADLAPQSIEALGGVIARELAQRLKIFTPGSN